MINHEEYVFLIIKPDGVHKNCIDDVLMFFEKQGLVEVSRKRKKLTKQFIIDNFSAKCEKNILVEYLSSGESEAVLLKGYDAYECVRIGKVEYRKKNNVDGELENLVHSPEAGNEYERQLGYFFTEIDNMKYCMYADLYAKPFYSDNENDFITALLSYDSKTNSNLVYVFPEEEFVMLRSFYKKYINQSEKSDWLFGIEYLCEINSKLVTLIGYYKTEDIEKINISDVNEVRQIQNVISEIKENGGIIYAGYSRTFLELNDDQIMELKTLGVDGIIIYHPAYTIEETAFIREKYLPYNFIIGGGSGGIAETGRYSVSYGMLQSLHDLVYITVEKEE